MWLCRSARHVRGPLRRRSRRHEQMQPAAPRGSCTRRADGDRPGAHLAASRRELRAAWLIYGKACHEAYMSGSQLHCRGPLIWGTVPGWRSCWRVLFLDCSVRLISAGWLPRDDYSAGACRCLGSSVKGLTVCSQLGLELAPSCCHVAAGTGPGGHFFARHVHPLPCTCLLCCKGAARDEHQPASSRDRGVGRDGAGLRVRAGRRRRGSSRPWPAAGTSPSGSPAPA